MKTKKCTKCGRVKPIDDFYIKKSNKDGLRYECISCIKEYAIIHKDNFKRWKKKNRKRLQKYDKEYHDLNENRLKEYRKKRYEENGDKIRESARLIREKLRNRKEGEIPYPKKQKCNKCGKIRAASKFSKQINYVNGLSYTCKECDKDRRKNNIEKIRRQNRQWNKNHRDEINKYKREKRGLDLNYKILCNLRSRMYRSIRSQNAKKTNRTSDLIGCSIDLLKKHIESKFVGGMSWDNYGAGGWSIDHVRPCATFNLIEKSEQEKCFNYKNLQPLWETDNFKKNSFYNGKIVRKNSVNY